MNELELAKEALRGYKPHVLSVVPSAAIIYDGDGTYPYKITAASEPTRYGQRTFILIGHGASPYAAWKNAWEGYCAKTATP